MAEIHALFTHHQWDLAEISCTQNEQEDEESMALYKWVIDVDKEHWDCAFYHVDLPSSEVSTDDAPPDADNLIHVSIQVRPEQEPLLRQFMMENGIERLDDAAVDSSSLNLQPGYRIMPSPDALQCQFCLCRPCVIDESNRQSWWKTQSDEPTVESSYLRKKAYYKFYTMLYHRGLWSNEQYLERKKAAGHQLRFKREIMPECVLNLVRSWHPNPDNRAYMGHRWL